MRVMSVRWIKKLQPPLPNFLIPAMAEEHDRFNPVETSSAGFDTDKKRAFIGAATGGMYCVDLLDGKTRWRFDVDDPVGSTPIYDKQTKAVFFGADDGNFYALHARSGRLLWKTDTGAQIRRKAVLLNNTLYVNTAANTIMALDPNNGELIWQYRRPPMEGFSSSGYPGIVVNGETLVTGFSDGYITAIDSITGTVTWEHDLASEISSISSDGTVKLIDVDATPVLVDGILVAASIAGGTHGLDAEKGTVLWTNPSLTDVSGLAESNGVVYAARSNIGLTALDPRTGHIVWSQQFNTGVLLDPVVHEDLLLLSDSMFGLYAVSSADGELLQRLDQRNGFFARPSLEGGYMLIIGNNGTLYAMGIL
jgi:outer membrane protein assembly factor BamB